MERPGVGPDIPKHVVIITPGLGDDGRYPIRAVKLTHELATSQWPRLYGLTPHTYDVNWYNQEKPTIDPILEDLRNLVKRFRDRGHTVSLAGTSAGGSASILAAYQCKDEVNAVAAVCSHLRTPLSQEEVNTYPLAWTGVDSPAFLDAVRKLHELQIAGFPEAFLRKVISVIAINQHGEGTDEYVPNSVSYLKGAKNLGMISNQPHSPSIAMALLHARPIANFLKSAS